MPQTFYDLVDSHIRRAFEATSFGALSWQAALADDISALEFKVDQLKSRDNFVQEFLAEPAFDFCISDVYLSDLLHSTEVDFAFGEVKCTSSATASLGTTCANWTCRQHANGLLPSNLLASSLTPPPPNVVGVCPNCLYNGAMVGQQAFGCAPLAVATWCPLCGCPSEVDGLAGFNTAIFYLAKIEPLKTLSAPELLLQLVIAIVGLLLYIVRAKILRNEIAISQRNFFTHHGSHPPRIQPQPASGLLHGKVFQP